MWLCQAPFSHQLLVVFPASCNQCNVRNLLWLEIFCARPVRICLKVSWSLLFWLVWFFSIQVDSPNITLKPLRTKISVLRVSIWRYGGQCIQLSPLIIIREPIPLFRLSSDLFFFRSNWMGYQKYTYHREFSLALSPWSNRLTRQRIKNKRRRNWYQVLTLLHGKLTNYSRYEQNPHDNDLALTDRHYWIKDERWTANYHLAGSLSRRDEENPVNWLAEHILPARAWSYDAFFIDQAHCAPSSFFSQYSLLPSLWKAVTNANIQPLFFC